MKITSKLWIWIAVLIILSPLGLLLPEHFKAGPAWGEWRMQKLSNLWKAPIPGYAFKGWEEKGLPQLSLAYVVSAIVGIGIVILIVTVIGKFLSKKGD